MKTIKILSLFILSIFVSSCDRSGIFEEFQKATSWEFHVNVFSDDNLTKPISDVNVNIYKTSEDRDNNTNILSTGKTNTNGEAVFHLKDFDSSLDTQKAKGIYYLKVEKDGIVKAEITRYLLMNDGHTYHFVTLK